MFLNTKDIWFGLFIGVMNDDYKCMFTGHHDYDTIYSPTGFTSTIIAARVSYVFNLQGPCLAVDTACSSGLISVHLGTQALLSGKLMLGSLTSTCIFNIAQNSKNHFQQNLRPKTEHRALRV